MRQPPRDPKDNPVQKDIERIVVDRDAIQRRIGELAQMIHTDYAQRELTIIAVLTGSLIFLADLVRCLPLQMRIDVVDITSYPDTAVRSQGPRVNLKPSQPLKNRDVLIVDDILDSGQTLSLLVKQVRDAGAASVRSCILLRKRRDDIADRIDANYVGFDIEDEFVVGYGLDYDNLYRNLPEIGILNPSAKEKRTSEGT